MHDEILELEAREELEDLGLDEDECAVALEQMKGAGVFEVPDDVS